MHYSTLSLERIVLTHLAASLWRPDEVREISRAAWNGWTEKAENAVIELVSKKTLSPHLQALPTPLRDKITAILGPVGKQLADWVKYHARFHSEYFALQSLKELSWSPLGTIDKRATAERWVTDERLKIDRRYRLACIYCLEPHIQSLWQQMSPTLKPYYFNAQNPKLVCEDPLVQFWTYRLEGAWTLLEASFKKELFRKDRVNRKPIPECTPEGYAFWRAVHSGNPVATCYFLSKLSHEEKQQHLIPCALEAANQQDRYRWRYDFQSADYTEVCVGLLRCMSESEQMEVFRQDIEKKGRNVRILRCLLEWPWQPYFLDTIKRVWKFMPQEIYTSLIGSIGFKLTKPNARLYQPMLEAYWVSSPLGYRRQYLADSYHVSDLVQCLIEYGDLINVKRLLEEMNSQEKEAILFSYSGRDICRYLSKQSDWKTLEWFTGLCLPSPPALLRFKEHLNHYLMGHYLTGDLPSWQPFFELLDRMASESPREIVLAESLASETRDGIFETPPETPPWQQSPLNPLKRAATPEEESLPIKRQTLWLLPFPPTTNTTQEVIPPPNSLML